jgi:hypothetical protein
MPSRLHVVVVLAAAVMASVALALPASANGYEAAFYTGTSLTGTKTSVDTTAIGQCENLAEPAKSASNITDVDIVVYFNADCQKGAPGQSGDLYFGLGSLSQANFPYPAASYRVVPMGS